LADTTTLKDNRPSRWERNAVIHTTRNHLFWDLAHHVWIKAGTFGVAS
jgi:hypothetical protein